MKLAAVTFTKQGEKIVEKLKEYIHVQHYSKENQEDFNVKTLGAILMEGYEGIIFIGATGIAVRIIAPYIKSKDKDPAVIVIDNECRFVISLLSGHLGGANELALQLSSILKAQPVITTATDSLGIEAPDMIAVKKHCVIENLTTAKEAAALLVRGEKVAFFSDLDSGYFPAGYVPYSENVKDEIKALVSVTNKKELAIYKELSMEVKNLKLIKKNIVLGIGCRKDYSSEKMQSFVERMLEGYNLDNRAVKLITTVEVKKNEKAILELAEYFRCPIKICTLEEIKTVQHKFKGSDFVEKTLGIRAVCEPCVDLCGARILFEKAVCEGMTLCVGEGE
jgi:cobalt-precorrin 5A hydrolase